MCAVTRRNASKQPRSRHFPPLATRSAPDDVHLLVSSRRCEGTAVALRARNEKETVMVVRFIAGAGLFSMFALVGCGARDAYDLAGAFGADSGKADAAKSTKLVDNIALDSTVQGTFDPRVRVYGYVFEAKRGAKLKASLTATAGSDANGVTAGAALDTYMAVYGPYTN